MAESKYKPKYAKELLAGLRKNGLSVAEICRKWKITRPTYYYWIKTNAKFAYAVEMGDLDNIAYWREMQREACVGNLPGCQMAGINLALKNEAGYVDKQEIEHTHNEQITTIRIERIESNTPRVIEHVRTQDMLDQQPS